MHISAIGSKWIHYSTTRWLSLTDSHSSRPWKRKLCNELATTCHSHVLRATAVLWYECSGRGEQGVGWMLSISPLRISVKLKAYSILTYQRCNNTCVFFYSSYWTQYLGVSLFYWDHLHAVHHTGKEKKKDQLPQLPSLWFGFFFFPVIKSTWCSG